MLQQARAAGWRAREGWGVGVAAQCEARAGQRHGGGVRGNVRGGGVRGARGGATYTTKACLHH
jgi:hypothetical protein